jgi:hypothetical protein
LAEWRLIVPDFASEYGIRLARWDGTWREFNSYLQGLADKPDCRIFMRFFAPDSTP